MAANSSLQNVEERLSSSRPFGDVDYIDECTADHIVCASVFCLSIFLRRTRYLITCHALLTLHRLMSFGARSFETRLMMLSSFSG